MMTPATAKAFASLGVSPDADPAQIKAAWRALVRTYHPDRMRGDTAAANRRLAELNAAFDLVSSWSPATQKPTPRRPTRPARPAKPDTAASRAAHDAACRHRAAEIDRQEAARKAALRATQQRAAQQRAAARKAAAQPDTPAARSARALFRAALKAISPKPKPRTLARL